MAIALIDKAIDGGSGTSATCTLNTTGANLLVVITTWYTWHTQTLTDGNSNSGWVTRTKFGTNVAAVQVRYILNPATVGAGHTFTINNSSGSGVTIAAYAFSGVGAFYADDGKDGVTSTSRSTNAITPPVNGSLLIAAVGFDNTSTESGAGTYIDLQQVNNGIATTHYIQSTAASAEETFSGSSVERATTQICFTPSIDLAALKTSLEAVWELSEASGSGTRNDSHGTNHLTLGSSVDQVAGKYSSYGMRCVSASSTWRGIADNTSLSFGAEDMAITAWVRITADNGRAYLFAKNNFNQEKSEYMLVWDRDANNKFSFRRGWNGGADRISVTANTFGSPAVDGTQWCWIYCYWQTGVGAGISVDNGTIDTEASTVDGFSGPSDFNIGRLPPDETNDYCDADIQQVCIWRRLLTWSERAAIYNAGVGLPYSSWSSSAPSSSSFKSLFEPNKILKPSIIRAT